MSIKKKVIFIIAFFLVLFVGGYTFLKYIDSSDWLTGTVAEGEYTLKTSLGDEFFVKYETINFPDYQTGVTIFDASGKRQLTYYGSDEDYYESKIDTLINTQDLRCYKIYDSVIFKKNGQDFKGLNLEFQTSPLDLKTNKDTQEFVEIAKKLVATKQWIRIKDCGKLLLSANDSEIMKTLERYALGEFTNEELEINKDSDLKKEDMQTFAKKVLEEKSNDITVEKK